MESECFSFCRTAGNRLKISERQNQSCFVFRAVASFGYRGITASSSVDLNFIQQSPGSLMADV